MAALLTVFHSSFKPTPSSNARRCLSLGSYSFLHLRILPNISISRTSHFPLHRTPRTLTSYHSYISPRSSSLHDKSHSRLGMVEYSRRCFASFEPVVHPPPRIAVSPSRRGHPHSVHHLFHLGVCPEFPSFARQLNPFFFLSLCSEMCFLHVDTHELHLSVSSMSHYFATFPDVCGQELLCSERWHFRGSLASRFEVSCNESASHEFLHRGGPYPLRRSRDLARPRCRIFPRSELEQHQRFDHVDRSSLPRDRGELVLPTHSKRRQA